MDAYCEDGPDGPEIWVGDERLTPGEASRLSRKLAQLVTRARAAEERAELDKEFPRDA